MRILHVISSGGMYGAEAVILNLSSALNKSSHHSLIGVFASDPKQPVPLHSAALARNLESHLVPCHGQIDLSVPSAIRSLAQRTRADLVHAHGYKADVYAYLSLRRTAIPLVSTCHTWYDNDLFVRLYGAIDRRVLRRYAGVVAVSEEVKQKLLDAGVSPSRVSLIRNGVDLAPFAHAEPNSTDGGRAPRVGLVGRLSPEKGIDLFIRAAGEVLKTHPATHFVIVGDGPDRSKLDALIHELGLSSNVALLGRSENMPGFYASLDLLVSASRQEGLPVALLEGMASALPVVATRVGAVPMAMQEGVTGLLVAPESVDALASGIRLLLDNPALRVKFGLGSRQRIQTEFAASHMAESYLELYRKIISFTPKHDLRS